MKLSIKIYGPPQCGKPLAMDKLIKQLCNSGWEEIPTTKTYNRSECGVMLRPRGTKRPSGSFVESRRQLPNNQAEPLPPDGERGRH